MNHQAALTAALAAERERKPYKKYTGKERYEIGKYESENGTAAACRKFKSKFNIGESTVQSFKNKYEQMMKSAKRKNETPEKVIKEKKRGRPIVLGEIDDMVQRFLLSLRKKDGVVNEAVARSVTKTLVKRSGKLELMSVNVDGKWWIQSLFRHMGFVRRAATTSKVEIPDNAKKEARLVYLHIIVSTTEKYQIPKSMILNLDKTP